MDLGPSLEAAHRSTKPLSGDSSSSHREEPYCDSLFSLNPLAFASVFIVNPDPGGSPMADACFENRIDYRTRGSASPTRPIWVTK